MGLFSGLLSGAISRVTSTISQNKAAGATLGNGLLSGLFNKNKAISTKTVTSTGLDGKQITEPTFMQKHGKKIGIAVAVIAVVVIAWKLLSGRSTKRRR